MFPFISFQALSEGAVASVLLSLGDGPTALSALQTVSLVGAIPFTFVLLGEVLATYKTLRIHLGELDVTKLVYWKYDIIEAFYQDKLTWLVCFVCPAYVQWQTRKTMVQRNELLKETDQYKLGFATGPFQLVWTVGYFTLYFLVILCGFLELAEPGFKFLALVMHLFWVVLCVGNRQLIKAYYGIDSSNLLFDFLSWTFCWCYAGVQENLQSRDGELVDLKVMATPKKKVAGDSEVELMNGGDQADAPKIQKLYEE